MKDSNDGTSKQDAVASSNGQNDSEHLQKDVEKLTIQVTSDDVDIQVAKLKMGQDILSEDETDRSEATAHELELVNNEANEAKSPALMYEYKDDQWSPINTMGKKYYEVDFLMALQNSPNSKIKPVIDNSEVVDSVMRHRDVGFIPNLARQHDMMPGFTKSSSQRGPVSKRGSQQGKQSPRATKGGSVQGSKGNVIHVSLSLREDIKLNESENAWKPGMLKKTDNVSDEERKTQELYKTVRGILNKLTPEKFNKLVGNLKELKIDTIDRLQGIINLVFEKAVDEPKFAVFYANMCKALVNVKVFEENKEQSDSQSDKQKSFRYLIINRCQNEFEREKTFENSPERANQIKAIAECKDPEKKKELQLLLEEEERKVRMKSVGNITFIGELFMLEMLSPRTMETCIEKLLGNIQEETLECLCKLLTKTGRKLEVVNNVDLSDYFKRIHILITKKDSRVSSRVRFMLQDVVELRNSGWIPRRLEVQAKPLDQIEQEAEDEQKHIERINSTPKGSARKDDRGSSRGRERGGRGGQGNDGGWSTPQSRPRQQNIDQAKLQKLKATNIGETKLGPSNMSWSRGSSTKSAASRSMGSPMSIVQTNPVFTGTNKFSALEASEAEPALQIPPKQPKDVRYSKGASIERFALNKDIVQQDSRSTSGPGFDSETQDTKPNNRQSPPLPEVKTESVPAEPLTEAEIEKINDRIKNCMNEYFSDLTKYVHIIAELQEVYKPRHMPIVLREILNNAIEQSQLKNHTLTRDLIFHMVKNGLITLDQYLDCLTENILSIASDLVIDLPKLYDYLGYWMTPHLRHQNLTFPMLLQVTKKAGEELQVDKFIGNILKHLVNEAGQPFVKQLWTEHKVQFTDWTPSEKVEGFIKDYQLEFLINNLVIEPPIEVFAESTEKCLLAPDETKSMIFNFLQKNQDQDFITNWIQNNIGDSVTEGWFLRALMKAVCDDALLPPGETTEREPRFSPMSEKRICDHVSLLIRYVENKENRELECLYAIQQLLDAYEHPSGVGLQLFDCFYKYEVISNEAFLAWEKDDTPHEQKGKGVLIKSLHSFFVELQEQENESGDDD